MRISSPSPRPASPTTFLLPLDPGPEMDGPDAGSYTPVPAPDDRASVHVPRQAASTSVPRRTGMDGRPVSRASAGAWPDGPMRIPFDSLEDAGSTTAGLATGDAAPSAPAPDSQDIPTDETDDHKLSVADVASPHRSRADQARAQARAAKLQMRAQAETARRAQAHATRPAVRDLAE
jgi:hypothetical protein